MSKDRYSILCLVGGEWAHLRSFSGGVRVCFGISKRSWWSKPAKGLGWKITINPPIGMTFDSAEAAEEVALMLFEEKP